MENELAGLSWETCEALAEEFGEEEFRELFPVDADVYYDVLNGF